MTLGKILNNIEDKETLVYVGAASGWLWIDTASETLARLDRLSNKILSSLNRRKKYFENARVAMKDRQKMLASELQTFGDDARFKRLKVGYTNSIMLEQKAERMLETINASLDAYKPLSSRNVRETFDNNLASPPGYAILIEGDENGKFWTYGECMRAKKKEDKHDAEQEDSDSLGEVRLDNGS